MTSDSYDFGRNWQSFIDGHLDPDRLERAKASLLDFLKVEDLQGRTWLDIGCGSGLFSLAAHDLGAERIVSMDVNPRSVACCRELHARRGSPENWQILDGSVLDADFMDSLGDFDIVYSWGVLHHTGEMWKAITQAAQRVRPGGLFYIAIYNSADSLGLHADGRPGTARQWEWEKKFYVSLPEWGKRVVDGAAAAGMVLGYILTLRNPVTEIQNHRSLRGMSWMVDIRDWLGGHPYEHARADEIFRFVHGEFGYELRNMACYNSLVNNEFLFARPE